MRALLPLTLAILSCAAPVHADSCEETIRGFYTAPDGLFDPSQLVPQEHDTVLVAPDGTETPYSDARWESVGRVVNFTGGAYYLIYDQAYYQGPSWEGPWESMGQTLPDDPVEFARGMNESVLASLRDFQCDGAVEVDGRTALRFAYHLRIEPPNAGSWWESDTVLFVDPDTGLRVRVEEHNLSESWAPDVKTDVRVTRVTLLPGYTIPNPPET